MKRTLICLILAAFALTALVPAVFAAAETLDAFQNIALNGSTEKYIDDPTTNDLGGNGTSIGFVAGYGCGNSSLNDIVAFENVDFGRTGALSITLRFGYDARTGETTDLDIYYDYPNNELFLAGECKISDTGGWSIVDAKEVTFPVLIPEGVHSVYIKFTTKNSGSFSYIRFGTEHVDTPQTQMKEYDGPPLADSAVLDIFTEELGTCFRLKHDMNVLFEDGTMKFISVADTNDPYVQLDMNKYYTAVKSAPVSADDCKCMVITARCDPSVTGTTFEVFGICNTVEQAGYGSADLRVPYVGDGETEYILFDFSNCSSWFGDIKHIRLDWNTGCREGAYMYIYEIRFMKDAGEALSFINARTGGGDSAEITDDATEPAATEAPGTEPAANTSGAGTEKAGGPAATEARPTGKKGCGSAASAAVFAAFAAAAALPLSRGKRRR